MSTVIAVENLSKKYVLGAAKQRGGATLRDLIADSVRGLGRRARRSAPHPGKRAATVDFWALNGVDFQIRQGDRVGIIGRNGAGKSTLLKLLSRITEPTSGKIALKGRVASLLEVGTGFHPELTGRENIFLNGAILGMTKVEIARKFDEIVAFAEVEQFLDTPVKRYSSGMYVRLAFAVAAHLEPEILIVDEVLAVGDAQFQKKCMGRMEAVGKEGRTVLFVSHNMNAIEQLCTSALRLEAGKLAEHGPDVRKVIRGYLSSGNANEAVLEWTPDNSRVENEWFSPLRIALTDADGHTLQSPLSNNVDAYISIEGTIETHDSALQIGYGIFNEDEELVYTSVHTDAEEAAWPHLQTGRNVLRSRFPARLLNEGAYRLELFSALYFRAWLAQPGNSAPSITFEIQGGLSDSPYYMSKRDGILAPILPWQRLAG